MTASTEPAAPSVRRQPGAAVLAALAMACLLTDGAGLMLLLGGDLIDLGYQHMGDLGTAGWRIWSAPKVLFLWAGVAWALFFAVLIGRVAQRRLLSLRRACFWGVGLCLVSLLVAPQWMDPRVDHYAVRGDVTTLMWGYPLFPLIAYRTKTERESSPSTADGSDGAYLCTRSRRWKLLSIELSTEFYPSLDEKNQQHLLDTRCERLPGSDR